VGDALHRRPAEAGAQLIESSRKQEFRPGSRTDGLAPISVAARSLAARPRHWIALGAIALAAVAADQLTKHVVASQLWLDENVKVLGPFSIHRVENSGIAFGLFAQATGIVILLTLVAIGWMVVYFSRSGARHPLLPIAVGLLVGGSISNLVDRVRLGHVTDFLDLRYWPAFNLADSFIVLGVVILLGTLVAADRAPRRPRGLDPARRS
jgi:signal peptidase II